MPAWLRTALAEAHWWDHIAPLLPGRQVVAIDLSGHGESGNRENYNARQWAREIVAVAADAVRGVMTVDTRFNDQAYPHRDKPSRVFASIARVNSSTAGRAALSRRARSPARRAYACALSHTSARKA